MYIRSLMRYLGQRRAATLVAAASGLAILWVVATGVAGPLVLRSAFEGRSFGALNRFFAAKGGRPVEFYLEKLRSLCEGGAAAILLMGFLTALAWRDTGRGGAGARRVAGEATPQALGFIRMIICVICIVMVSLEDLGNAAAMPASLELRAGQGFYGVVQVIPGASRWARDAASLAFLQYATLAFLSFGAVGLFSRVTIPLATLGYFLLGGVLRSYSHFFHTGCLPLYALAILSVSPCADGWSFDRVMRLARAKPVAPAVPALAYGWTRFAIWLVVALSYFSAGVSKIRHGGWLWWEGVNLKTIVLADALSPRPTNWQVGLMLEDAPEWLFAGLGVATLVIELGFILVPFSRLSRLVLPVCAVGMHVGIWLMQNVLFIDLILMQAVFYNYSGLQAAIGRRAYRWVGDRAPAQVARPDASESGPPAEPSAVQRAGGSSELWASFLAVVVFIVMSMSVAFDVEFYPLSAWSMYSGHVESTEIEYLRFIEVTESGERRPTAFHPVMPVTRDGRYFDVVSRVYLAEAQHAPLREFLVACGARRNRELSPGNKVVAYEIERWSWDYRRSRESPLPGRLVGKFVQDIDAVK